MSIDTTFHPITQAYAVDSTAAGVQIKEAGQLGATTFRVYARAAVGTPTFLAWGTVVPAAPAVVVVGTPKPNQITIPGQGVVYLELPPNVFFIAGAGTTVDINGGMGGVGG